MTTHLWDFGDGHTDNKLLPDPHRFPVPSPTSRKTFLVRYFRDSILVASNNVKITNETLIPIVAEFSWAEKGNHSSYGNYSHPPFLLFDDSTGTPTSWSWKFYNNLTEEIEELSTDQNPSLVLDSKYIGPIEEEARVYVQLTVTNLSFSASKFQSFTTIAF